ncbi:Vacuolar protein sorting-associated protein 52 -like protein [Trichinella zimbabwensis]|uniref:Vacuolar protein sorting-associated protein 52 homolog n=1 Tax=Trichinella zimbabwensis TaxID=268475 RepID=A0A0V1H5D0_9BILA|nr:Vacuolar protein sorting-associated protein 52 -like protein [Trichinella zimbabwensis]
MHCNDDDAAAAAAAANGQKKWTKFVIDHPNEDVVQMLDANSVEQWKKDNVGSDVAEIEVTVQSVNPLAGSSEQRDVSNQPTTTIAELENGITVVVVMPLRPACKMLSFTRFDTNHVPRAMLSNKLSITVEDYVTAMELLTNDFRFRLYAVFHQRIVLVWLIASLIVMLCVLFSNARGLVLFALSLGWSSVIGLGTLLCVIFERMLNQSLNACVATVNRFLVRHNLLLCVDDRGKFSCHKIAIVFLYFNLDQCTLEVSKSVEKFSLKLHREHHLPMPTTPSVCSQVDIVAPATAQNKENAKRLMLQHTQQYCRDLVRQVINLPVASLQDQTDDLSTVKHCKFALCLCQYLKKCHFQKRRSLFFWSLCGISTFFLLLCSGLLRSDLANNFCLIIFKNKIMSTEKDHHLTMKNDPTGIIGDKATAVDAELLSEILGMGIDLREYAKDVQKQLKSVEADAIQEYVEQAENIATLHNEIRNCDQILNQMESMLTAFQSDLGNISNEIQSLQEQSVKMSVKLKNRQAVRGELSQFIDEIVVPEVMIKTIIDEPVSERLFLEQLHELQHKIAFVKQQGFREALSCVEVEGLLENLRLKATEKTRDFLLKRIYQFRKPMANYPVTQGTLLKYRFYFEFILSNDRYVAKEIRDEYVNTTSKIFYTYFKTYASRLMKLQLDDVATKDDLLGSDDSAKMVNMFSVRPNVRNRATVFSLGSRMSVLKEDLEAPIIVPHAADQNKQKFQFEVLFRSLLYAVLDHACREYFFLCDFFLVSGQHSVDMFDQVFSKALLIVTNACDANMANCFDCIALLLCIHIVYRYQAIGRQRGLPVLEKFWEQLLLQLWLRFEQILTANLTSMRDLDVKRLAPLDSRPHFIIRRYGEFFAALTAVNADLPDEKLQQYLYRLENEVAHLLARAMHEFKSIRERTIFLINNYDLIVSVLMEKLPGESIDAQESSKRLQAYITEYAELLLTTHFGSLVNFVYQAESLIEQGMQEKLKDNSANVRNVVKTFNNDWKKNIEQINQEVMSSFSNFRVGTAILQKTFSQLIQYYHRLHKVLAMPTLNHPARNELVNIHNLMVEVKKYKPMF